MADDPTLGNVHIGVDAAQARAFNEVQQRAFEAEALREENARLRKALREIDALLPDIWLTGMSAQVRRIARAALGDQTVEAEDG